MCDDQNAGTSGCRRKAELDYPTPWTYTVIGANESQLRELIAGLVGDRDHEVSLSNRSSSGKYTSLTLTLTVRDDLDRLNLFEALQAHPAVKFVL